MPVLIPGPGQPIFPGPDSDFAAYAVNFGLQWDPETFDVSSPNPAALATLISAYEGALATATNPTTRTSVAVGLKNLRRSELETQLRLAVRAAVAAFRVGFVDSSPLTLLGIRTPELTPSRIAVPAFAPGLSLKGSRPGFTDLRLTQFVDGTPVETRKFPYGVVSVEISRQTGSTWVSQGFRRRVNLSISTTDLANGTIASYRVRYINPRGEAGPWSDSILAAAVVGS